MNAVAEYIPNRGSTRTEREGILYKIGEVQTRIAEALRKSEAGFDPAFARTVARLKRELATLQESLSQFDARHRAIDEAAISKESKIARNAAYEAAKQFEKKLIAFASAALELRNKSDALAKAMQIRDPGRFPHPQQVEPLLSARVIDIVGGAGGINLPGYGSSLAKKPGDISKLFE